MSGMSTAAFISLGLSAAGTVASFAGQIRQQEAQQQQAAQAQAQAVYQSQIARQNQTLAQRQADDARQRGHVAEMNRRNLAKQQIGTQLAGLAAQGTDLEGSPIDILGDTAAAAEQDALTLRANAGREAYGYEVQAMGFGNEALLQNMKAANSTYTPNYLGAGASLLSGAGTLADKWKKFQDDENTPFVDTSYGGKGGLGTINGNTFG